MIEILAYYVCVVKRSIDIDIDIDIENLFVPVLNFRAEPGYIARCYKLSRSIRPAEPSGTENKFSPVDTTCKQVISRIASLGDTVERDHKIKPILF